MKNAGKVPYVSNRNEVDLRRLAGKYGWTHAEIVKATSAFAGLYWRQPASTITFREYLDMMRSAGLRPLMIGKRLGQYNLARFRDKGVYAPGNCRFVRREVNRAEARREYTPEWRALISERAKARRLVECEKCGKAVQPHVYARVHGERCKGPAEVKTPAPPRRLTCACGVSASPGMFARWHGDRCRHAA